MRGERISSSQTSTKMMSGPILQIFFQGMMYSWSGVNRPQSLEGPGTMIEQMVPVHSSKIRSQTRPRRLQLQRLMTSLDFRSEKRMMGWLLV